MQHTMSKIQAKSIFGDTLEVWGKVSTVQKNGKQKYQLVITSSTQHGKPGNWSGEISLAGYAVIAVSFVKSYKAVLSKAEDLTNELAGGAPHPGRLGEIKIGRA